MTTSPSTPRRSRREGVASRQIGRYEVTSALGQGAMGVVYRAHDPLLDRHVAIKVMASTLASDPVVKARFEREARAAARLAHPNIVTVYDFGYHEGAPFVVMELLRGQDLRAALLRGGDLPRERRLSVLWQVLAGLAHAHGAGVVHRDVKPANIFLTDAGGVKVLDFGMARVTWAGSVGSGGVVGTFDYMSPEQVESRHVDGRSDVFSAGSVLCELLAGHPPFQADSMVSTAYRIVHAEPDFDGLPEDAAALLPVLRRALAKDPAARYSTAREFAADLAERGGAPWRAYPVDAVPEEPADRLADAEDEGAGLADAAPPLPADAALPLPAAAAPALASARRLPGHGAIWAAAIVLAAAGAVTYSALRPVPVAAPTPASAPSLEPSASAPPAARTAAAPNAPRPRVSPAALSPAASPAASPAGAAAAAPGEADRTQPAPLAAGRVVQPLAVGGPTAAAPVKGRWKGYITDESCRQRGAVPGHWSCAQVCMRKGFRPLLDVDGRLYVLDGVQRVRGDKNGMVTVEGTLDPATATIHVVEES